MRKIRIMEHISLDGVRRIKVMSGPDLIVWGSSTTSEIMQGERQ